MTTFDVICFNQELMDRMNKLGIKLNDTQYIELYKEYSRMLENNEKTTYIVRALSERYNVSERNVYKIIKRFKKALHTRCSIIPCFYLFDVWRNK